MADKQPTSDQRNRAERDKLRQVINRARDRAIVKTNLPRRTGFIASPPKTKAKSVPKQPRPPRPLFAHVNPAVVNPFAHYRIPKHPIAITVNSKSVVSNERVVHPPKVVPKPSAPADSLPTELTRTQIKNRKRRLEFKKLRLEQQQNQQK